MEAQIQLALADLAKQDTPNYMATSKKYTVPRTTLRERFLGNRQSREAATAEYHQCLSMAQEEALICQINRLTNRGLPPTNVMVKNLAEEIIGRAVDKNWSSQFMSRHKRRLISNYLKNIDKKRVNSEYVPMYELFYDLVYDFHIYCVFCKPNH